MKNTVQRLGILALAAVIIGVALTGCETESASQPLTITVTPSVTTITRGQAVTFTATGGYEYQWRLSNTSYGLLSSTTGNQVTYTAYASPATGTVTVILTATSVLPGQTVTTTTTTTNAVATTVSSGQAAIQHQ